MTPSELFTVHAHHAYAYAFWKDTDNFGAFIDVVDDLMDETHGHQRVLGNVSMARIVTKQVRRPGLGGGRGLASRAADPRTACASRCTGSVRRYTASTQLPLIPSALP